ncbi:MAG: DUF523 domain-containing protein [Bacilli bacterium]|nr:DUF523 domain-containing protein [Bacilli bacterium]
MKVLVSACLLGINCKYNGGNNKSDKLITFLNESTDCTFFKFCPECLAGFPIPHNPIEYVNGKLIDKDGNIYNKQLEKGQCEISKILDNNHFDLAITKAKSPSCGKGKIYDGSFTKTLVDGDGFAVELIKAKGIKVITEDEL